MSVAEKLVELLQARGMTCATAESCTGGGVGAAITAVAGSSAIFKGGIIAYANEIKHAILGVDSSSLEKFGAVSGEVAGEMALGAKKLLNVNLAVAVTGVAGPGGGSAEKPVGTVWFGIATSEGVRTEKCLFAGNREKVRQSTIIHALGMLTAAAIA